MHAIVRLDPGKYYISAVFGYYRGVTVTEGYEGDLQSFFKPYWIVWDEKGEDGFGYLVDDCEMTVDQISHGNCYFKARHMKYRVVPD